MDESGYRHTYLSIRSRLTEHWPGYSILTPLKKGPKNRIFSKTPPISSGFDREFSRM